MSPRGIAVVLPHVRNVQALQSLLLPTATRSVLLLVLRQLASALRPPSMVNLQNQQLCESPIFCPLGLPVSGTTRSLPEVSDCAEGRKTFVATGGLRQLQRLQQITSSSLGSIKRVGHNRLDCTRTTIPSISCTPTDPEFHLEDVSSAYQSRQPAPSADVAASDNNLEPDFVRCDSASSVATAASLSCAQAASGDITDVKIASVRVLVASPVTSAIPHPALADASTRGVVGNHEISALPAITPLPARIANDASSDSDAELSQLIAAIAAVIDCFPRDLVAMARHF